MARRRGVPDHQGGAAVPTIAAAQAVVAQALDSQAMPGRPGDEGLSDYRLGGSNGGDGGPALVVGYATPPGHAYSTAVARLCAVLSAGD